MRRRHRSGGRPREGLAVVGLFWIEERFKSEMQLTAAALAFHEGLCSVTDPLIPTVIGWGEL